MPAEFLDCELDEISRERQKLDMSSFNSWFDAGPVKKRFKKAAMQQQRLRCCYCRRLQLDHNNNLWDLEHVLCESLYPQFFADPGNLAVACKRCNIAKKQKDVLDPAISRPLLSLPSDNNCYTIPHPHLSEWSDHVKHTAHLIYEALTAQGRELIVCCELNGKAEEAIGVTPGAIRTAIATSFFARVGSRVARHISEQDVECVIVAATETVEDMQLQQAFARLRRSLATYEREARKRAQSQDNNRDE